MKFNILAAVSMLCILACSGKSSPTIKPVVPEPEPEEEDLPEAEVGKVIPAWKEGCLDIHFINTSMGECSFIIFPDGTQMLVDAAGSTVATGNVSSSATNTGIRSRWDPTKEAGFDCGKFIEEYIGKCMAWTGNSKIDYAVLTHLHNDHYGSHLGRPVSKNSGTYVQQSLVTVMDDCSIGLLLDRGYPDYNYPFNFRTVYKTTDESSVINYITAVEWHVANKGLKVEKFKAGSSRQIQMTRKASDYPDFKVQNIAVNGNVWDLSEGGSTATFPSLKDITCAAPPSVAAADKCPEENHESCVFKLTYGKFDYWGGGDMQYDGISNYSWKDIESAASKVCGKVEVMKADHHGTANTNGFGTKGTTTMSNLQPQCWIVNSWTDVHPRQATYEGVTELLPNMDTFITNTCKAQESYKHYDRLKGADGHIVVRVAKGGNKYFVYTLTDSDRQMTVKKIAGPYYSR